MKKTIVVCFLLMFLFVQNISAQELGGLFTASSGEFTMSMPLGWYSSEIGFRHSSIIPQNGIFPPIIAFDDEAFSEPVSVFLDAHINRLIFEFPRFELLNRSSFRTNAGETGELITYLITMGQVQVRQRAYVIPNRNRTAIMLITSTTPAIGGERYDEIFDASVRTFSWTR